MSRDLLVWWDPVLHAIRNGLEKTLQMHEMHELFSCLENIMLFGLPFPLHWSFYYHNGIKQESHRKKSGTLRLHCLCCGQFVSMRGACAFLCCALMILMHRFIDSLCLAVNESSCVHSSNSWKEWKREYSKEGATKRKRKGFQTRTGIAMAAFWPSSNRSNQQPSTLSNRGSEISSELAWFMGASKQDMKIKHWTPNRTLLNSTKQASSDSTCRALLLFLQPLASVQKAPNAKEHMLCNSAVHVVGFWLSCSHQKHQDQKTWMNCVGEVWWKEADRSVAGWEQVLLWFLTLYVRCSWSRQLLCLEFSSFSILFLGSAILRTSERPAWRFLWA